MLDLCQKEERMPGYIPLLMSVLVLTAILAGTVAQPVAANGIRLGIPGQDDRETVEDDRYPWRTIGRVNNAGRSYCTGVLIGHRRVLTAAHCLRSPGAPGGLSKANDIHFLAGYSRGSYLAHSRAIAIDRSWTSGVQAETADDWAVITLGEPIGKQVGFLKLERFGTKTWQQDRRSGTRYAQAGYSHDRSHILTRHINCEIQGFLKGGQAFAHQCDATNGDSGSPILVRRGRTYSIVGLHVASARDRGFGIAITAARIYSQLPNLTQLSTRSPPR